MEHKEFKKKLEELGACERAVDWVCKNQYGLDEAWKNCQQGSWMLWIYRRADNYEHRIMALASGHCANTVKHLMLDERSRRAVEVCIMYGQGEASLEELNEAAYAATAAAYVYAANAANVAAAAAAAYAATASASAAAAAYAATAAAADAAAARKIDGVAASICRKYLPTPIFN